MSENDTKIIPLYSGHGKFLLLSFSGASANVILLFIVCVGSQSWRTEEPFTWEV